MSQNPLIITTQLLKQFRLAAASDSEAVLEDVVDDCPICTEPLEADTTKSCSQCGKGLHKECHNDYVAHQLSNNTNVRCPLCRAVWLDFTSGLEEDNANTTTAVGYPFNNFTPINNPIPFHPDSPSPIPNLEYELDAGASSGSSSSFSTPTTLLNYHEASSSSSSYYSPQTIPSPYSPHTSWQTFDIDPSSSSDSTPTYSSETWTEESVRRGMNPIYAPWPPLFSPPDPNNNHTPGTPLRPNCSRCTWIARVMTTFDDPEEARTWAIQQWHGHGGIGFLGWNWNGRAMDWVPR